MYFKSKSTPQREVSTRQVSRHLSVIPLFTKTKTRRGTQPTIHVCLPARMDECARLLFAEFKSYQARPSNAPVSHWLPRARRSSFRAPGSPRVFAAPEPQVGAASAGGGAWTPAPVARDSPAGRAGRAKSTRRRERAARAAGREGSTALRRPRVPSRRTSGEAGAGARKGAPGGVAATSASTCRGVRGGGGSLGARGRAAAAAPQCRFARPQLAGGPLSSRFPSADGAAPSRAAPVGMFQAGTSGVPRPAPRSLDDLDSVQRVLLHRSVLRRGGDARGSRLRGPPKPPRGAPRRALAREGRGPAPRATLCVRGVSPLASRPGRGRLPRPLQQTPPSTEATTD